MRGRAGGLRTAWREEIGSGGSDVEVDEMAYRRGAAAYMGLNRTDPLAVWSFQGWAFIGWNTQKQASFIKGFVDATPDGKFVVIDMSVNGEGEWKKWDEFFAARPIRGADLNELIAEGHEVLPTRIETNTRDEHV